MRWLPLAPFSSSNAVLVPHLLRRPHNFPSSTVVPASGARTVVAEQIGGVLSSTFIADVVGGLCTQIIKPEILDCFLERWILVDRGQFRALKKAAKLKVEVAQMRAQADEWTKRGGRAKLENCGTSARLCVRVDKRVAYGESSDYFVLKGY